MLHAVTRLFGSRTGSAIAWEFVAATRPFSRALPAKRLGCANPQNKEAVWSQSQRKIDRDAQKGEAQQNSNTAFYEGHQSGQKYLQKVPKMMHTTRKFKSKLSKKGRDAGYCIDVRVVPVDNKKSQNYICLLPHERRWKP